MEDFVVAERAFEACLENFPTDRDTLRHLGSVRYKLHMSPESLAAYLKVLALDPEDRAAHKRRLDIYRQLGREAEAAAAQAAFEKYKSDDEAEQVARDFLLKYEEINDEAQSRHVHR
jgi:tetratricopeptide (TPR) repeat protein